MRLRRALVALLAVANLGAADAPSRSIEFLHVEANVGTAAAGHLAIRFGNDVYSFQNAGGDTLRLSRTNADFLRYRYTVLENRTIHVAAVEVDDETWHALRDRFNARHLAEGRHFATLASLRADRELVERMGAAAEDGRPPVPLPGAGYFLPERSGVEPALARLRERIRSERGAAALEDRVASLEREIRTLAPRPADPAALVIDPPGPAAVHFSERFAALAIDLLAVRVLQHALPLREGALRRASGEELTRVEAQLLAAHAEALETRLVALLDSSRPDWGQPLLTGMARLVALDESRRSGRLIVLDTFPADAQVVRGDSLRSRSAFLADLHRHARLALDGTRSDLAQRSSWDERDYQLLEESANRYLEYDQALAAREEVRMYSAVLVPAAEPARVALPLPRSSDAGLSGAELARIGRSMEERERSYAERLDAVYGYDLVQRNCVTEIFEIIDRTFPPAESRERLGGHVEIGTTLRVIPRVAFAAVREHYRVTRVGEIPSFRRARLAEMYTEESPALVYLRESNTLTSSIYRRNDRDSLFVFFTDDEVAPRPLLGAVNLVAGVLEAASGVLRLPFDGGRSLVAGGKGALFSVPELFFVNLRKGSLEYGRSEDPRTRLEIERP